MTLLIGGRANEAVAILEQIVIERKGADSSNRDAKMTAGLGLTLENLAAARRRAGDEAGALESQRAAADAYLQVCAAVVIVGTNLWVSKMWYG